MEEKRPLQSIPDDELLHRLAELMVQSRRVEADVVAHIGEVDERRLYAREAFPSMFVYCRDVLHLSEAEAYLRILAARVSRKHPLLLTMLADGRLHLTAIGILEQATHRSKRQIQELIAEISPRPDVPTMMRKLPTRRTQPTASPLLVVPNRGESPMLELSPDGGAELRPPAVAAPEPGARLDEAALGHDALQTPALAVAREASAGPASPPVVASPGSPPVVQPLSPGRYKVQFTASAELHRKLEQLSALMGSKAGDLAAVIEQAVTEKLERLEARRFARTRAPRKRPTETGAEASTVPASPLSASRTIPPASRCIPAAVRRAVRERDGNRCRYVDEQGRRCPERHRLQFHHRHPFGLGGDHGVANIQLMCRAHNDYLAACDYGREAMARHRRPCSRASPPAAS
jgi:hypothetical protein